MPVRVLVPTEVPAGFRYPKVAQVNYIDKEVQAKLRRLNRVPSDLCTDGELLRRVTLDTIGTLPTPEELKAFLADKRPDKRSRKIDELLARPMHAALWATKLCDVTGNTTTSGYRAADENDRAAAWLLLPRTLVTGASLRQKAAGAARRAAENGVEKGVEGENGSGQKTLDFIPASRVVGVLAKKSMGLCLGPITALPAASPTRSSFPVSSLPSETAQSPS